MKKKIIVVCLIVVISIIIIFIVGYRNNLKTKSDNNNFFSASEEIKKDNIDGKFENEESKVESEVTNKNTAMEVIPPKTNNTEQTELQTNKPKANVENKQKDILPKQDIPKEYPKNEIKKEPTQTPQPTPKPEDDQEYKKLLVTVEYVTEKEAMDVGFAKSFEDTVNILGFNCVEVIYKGKVLGYKVVYKYK